MSMKNAVTSVLSKYAAFEGRARRSEYWYWALFTFLVSFVFGILQSILEPLFRMDPSSINIFDVIFALYSLAVLVPGLAVAWRRLHDIGKSGACIFLGLIPLVGMIILLVWYCKDSQPGENIYGPNPKEENPQPTQQYDSYYTP